MIEAAIDIVEKADVFVIIGTSMNVYPAAGLLNYVPRTAEVYLIDPKPVSYTHLDVYKRQECVLLLCGFLCR